MTARELNIRLGWFIKLRWLAVIGIFLIISASVFILKIKLPFNFLYAGVAALFLFNVIFYFYHSKLKKTSETDTWHGRANTFANIQISTDLIMLMYLLYFSGGIENPFIFYFIFHMITASIILPKRDAYMQATLAVGILGFVIILESMKVIPYYPIGSLISEGQTLIFSRVYTWGVFGAMASTLYLAVYLTSSISEKLIERERALTLANKQLAEQDRIKSRYVLTVTHDIQSGLAAIQNCIKVVLEGFTGDITEKTKEMLGRADRRTLSLLNFVRDLLHLSKIRASEEFKKEEFPLNDIINNVIEEYKPFIEDKKLTLSCEIPMEKIFVYANKETLKEVFINLLNNAIKYTPSYGKIGIHVKSVPDKKGCFHIKIWDTGIGIPASDINKIFDEFYRSRNAQDMDKQGTGLGLSIVKEVLKLHKSNIRVESIPGKGTSFFLPCQTRVVAVPAS
ncbi:MAG: ATP-binding protein [Candidatus Omnitrophica bacterium]|nr:ATP-binding protein [Candidatus Omnitrophota bacterium]